MTVWLESVKNVNISPVKISRYTVYNDCSIRVYQSFVAIFKIISYCTAIMFNAFSHLLCSKLHMLAWLAGHYVHLIFSRFVLQGVNRDRCQFSYRFYLTASLKCGGYLLVSYQKSIFTLITLVFHNVYGF